MSIKNNNGPYKEAITGLLLTLNNAHPCAKSAQIEEVARSENPNYYVSITAGVHTHAPAPPTTYWFSFDLIDGDMTPETIHIYIEPISIEYITISSPAAQSVGAPPGAVMSVENKLKPGIEWY